MRISAYSYRKQNLTHCKEDISMVRTIWKRTGLFYCFLSVPSLEMLNQTTLQQERAMHIRSIVSLQYDYVFEQGFKNSLLPAQFLILLPHLLGQGIQNDDSSAMKQMFTSCKFNSLRWPKKCLANAVIDTLEVQRCGQHYLSFLCYD